MCFYLLSTALSRGERERSWREAERKRKGGTNGKKRGEGFCFSSGQQELLTSCKTIVHDGRVFARLLISREEREEERERERNPFSWEEFFKFFLARP